MPSATELLKCIEAELSVLLGYHSTYRNTILDLVDQYGHRMYEIGYENGLDRGVDHDTNQ